MKNIFVCFVVVSSMFACNNSSKAKEEAVPATPVETLDATPVPATATEEMKPEVDPMAEMSLDATPVMPVPAPAAEMK